MLLLFVVYKIPIFANKAVLVFMLPLHSLEYYPISSFYITISLVQGFFSFLGCPYYGSMLELVNCTCHIMPFVVGHCRSLALPTRTVLYVLPSWSFHTCWMFMFNKNLLPLLMLVATDYLFHKCTIAIGELKTASKALFFPLFILIEAIFCCVFCF